MTDYRMDVLEAAWERVRRNKGGPGVDGVTIEQIVESDQGVAGFLEGLQETLRHKTYRPGAVRRVCVASGHFNRRKESRGIASSKGLAWSVWPLPIQDLCKPETRVFRRAGRGKSATPVRRGESGTRLHPLPSLLLYRLSLTYSLRSAFFAWPAFPRI